MTPLSEQLPRIFQANIGRLYQRVVQPNVERLPVHDELSTGVASSMDEFLERAARQVDNCTANEANKVFALVLAAVFERQLRVWAPHLLDSALRSEIPSMQFGRLLSAASERAGIDLQARDLRKDLDEAFLVANVVRHGDGSSSRALRVLAPQLWHQGGNDYVDLLVGPAPQSEMLRIGPDDLRRYARGMIRYWGLADPQVMAVTEGFI